ncbi:MAG: beta-lactamase family protein [Clostridiales Family XIII bacterium]|jgi:CubicO group peptidase (beta-lactamase class C family)|nr:beta-lactamase family protein [Clostridiales Family XIII bacterium]
MYASQGFRPFPRTTPEAQNTSSAVVREFGDAPAPSKNRQAMRARDLLCMSTGHAQDATLPALTSPDGDWIETFLSLSVEYAPGAHFPYNTGASFMLSAILQKVSGEKLPDCLAPRLCTKIRPVCA